MALKLGTYWEDRPQLMFDLERLIDATGGFKFEYARAANWHADWNDVTSDYFPKRVRDQLAPRKVQHCMVPFPRSYGTDGDNSGWDRAANGEFESYYRTFLQRLVAACPGTYDIIVSYAYEHNGDWWYCRVTSAKTAQYRAAFKRFCILAHSISPRLKTCLNLVCHNVTTGNCTTAAALMVPPENGVRYVDYIGMNFYMKPQYQGGVSPTAMWNWWLTGGGSGTGWNVGKNLANQYGIPFIIPEIGLATFANTNPGQSRSEAWSLAQYRDFLLNKLAPKVLTDVELLLSWPSDNDYPGNPLLSGRPVMAQGYKEFYTKLASGSTAPVDPGDPDPVDPGPVAPDPTPIQLALLDYNNRTYAVRGSTGVFSDAQKTQILRWEGISYWPLVDGQVGGKTGTIPAGADVNPISVAMTLVSEMTANRANYTDSALASLNSWIDLLLPFVPESSGDCVIQIQQATAPLNAQISQLQTQVNALNAQLTAANTARVNAETAMAAALTTLDTLKAPVAAYRAAHTALMEAPIE